MAVKWNVGYLCRGYQNWRKIRVELQVVMARIQQARNLWCERGNNDIGRKASITRSLGCGRHQHRLPLQLGNHLRYNSYHCKAQH